MSWSVETADPKGDSWNQLLGQTNHLLFHEPVWSDVIHDGVSSRTTAIIFKQNGQIMSGASGFFLGGYGIKLAYFNYPYGGIIGTPPPVDWLQKLLKQFAIENRVCQIQMVGFPGALDYSGNEFEFANDATHILDLTDVTPESLWTGYRRSRRQDIRKTRELGIEIELTTDQNEVDLVHDFYLQTMKRTGGLARYKKQLLRSIVKHLAPQARAHMYLAKLDSKPIAGMLLVDSANMSHGLLMACSDVGLQHHPNKLMLHTAAEHCTQKGISRLDYMPSGQNSSGVSNFKNLWGAGEVKLKHSTLVTMKFRSLAWRTAFGLAKRQPLRTILSAIRSRS